MEKRSGFLILVFLIIILSSFAIAEYIITTSDGGTSYNYDEDIANVYNLTVNNTYLTLDSNITQVNITLPESFNLIDSSNSSDAYGSLIISGNNLSWTNDTSGLVMNLSWKYFSFNATAGTPGNYNITVTTTNASGSFSSNIGVTINDTTAPSITFNTPSDNYINWSRDYVVINITANESYSSVDTITLRFYNSTHYLLNETSSTGVDNHYFNRTNLSEGVYYYNVTVNDSDGNEINDATRSLRLDRTVPDITRFAEDDDGEDYVNMTIDVTDGGSGVMECTSDEGTISKYNETRWYLYEEDLDCGESYGYNVTCTDFAGNSDSSSVSATTDSCSSSGGSSSSSSTSTSFWTKTHSTTEQQAEDGFAKSLEKGERIKVRIESESHYVGIIKLTSTSATINISSDPQQEVFNVGETKSFEVTGDNYYDVKVKLNSVNSTIANVTVWSINELMPEINASSTTINATNEDAATNSTGGMAFFSKTLKSVWFWVGFGLVILAISGSLYYLRKRNIEKGIKTV